VVQFKLAPSGATSSGVDAQGGDAQPDDGGSAGEPDPISGGSVSPLVWVGFGVGAAGLLAGTITGAITLSETSALEDECPDKRCTPDQQDALDDAHLIGNISTGAFIVGGVGVAVGIIGLALTDWGGSSPKPNEGEGAAVNFTPLIGPGTIGVRGSF
jgi:hypothetical protein